MAAFIAVSCDRQPVMFRGWPVTDITQSAGQTLIIRSLESSQSTI